MVPARCLWASMGHPSRPRVSTSAVDGTAVMRRRGRLRLLMTLMYGPAVHRKRFSSICRLAVLHQCIRPLIGACCAVLRAIMDISAPAVSLPDRPQAGPFGSPGFACARNTGPPSHFILSQTSVGKRDTRPSQHHARWAGARADHSINGHGQSIGDFSRRQTVRRCDVPALVVRVNKSARP